MIIITVPRLVLRRRRNTITTCQTTTPTSIAPGAPFSRPSSPASRRMPSQSSDALPLHRACNTKQSPHSLLPLPTAHLPLRSFSAPQWVPLPPHRRKKRRLLLLWIGITSKSMYVSCRLMGCLVGWRFLTPLTHSLTHSAFILPFVPQEFGEPWALPPTWS